MQSDTPMLPTYDTRTGNSDNPALATLFNLMVNQPVVIHASAEGRVIDVTGFERLAQVGPLKPQLEAVFSANSLKQMPLFPTAEAPSPATVGSSWKALVEVDVSLGPQTATMLRHEFYRLDRVDEVKKLAEIACQAQVSMKESEATKAMNLTIPSGAVTGRLLWDLTAGELVRAETATRMVIQMNAGGGLVRTNQDVSMKLTRTTPDALDLDKDARKPAAAEQTDDQAD
jgi:hypothetical protein